MPNNSLSVNPPDVRARFRDKCDQSHCVWLNAPALGEGKSLLAARPVVIFRAKGDEVEILTRGNRTRQAGNPFDLLNEQLARHRGCTAIGYFGYDLKNFVERLPATPHESSGVPDCWFGFYDEVEVVSHPFTSGGPRAVVAAPSARTRWSASLQSNFTREAYRQVVGRAKEYIAAGDIYQVNLSQRFQCDLEAAAPDVYLALCAANPAPYAAYLDLGDAQVLSSSPECFLHLHGRQVVTRPIKGTRPRAVDPAELLASPKDNAELVMITDLERNDLGRVCEFGSVRVPELVRVESYSTVHHLVSTVTGQLRSGVSHVDCVRACFPGGSITGAPKIRAMEIIDELEPQARGVYCGAIGFFAPDGISQFNIAIRTAVYQSRGSGFQPRPAGGIADTIRSHNNSGGGRLTFHAGGGIVADSDPAAEYEETLAKAQGIINAIDQLRLH